MMWYIKIVLLGMLTLVSMIYSEKLDYLSFETPIKKSNMTEIEIIAQNWRVVGATRVNSNFVRLTPDQKSSTGAMWSRNPTAVNELSVVMKFRLSGKDKKLYGNGLSFWLVTQGYYTEGPLNGFQDRFIGIGIMIDTSIATPMIHPHISVLMNDGNKDYEMMTSYNHGCQANIRYDSSLGSFDPTKSISQLKFRVTDNSFDLFIDEKNTGDWKRCVQYNDLSLPAGWVEHAHIGLTATTGIEKLDNHDILSISTYHDAYVMERDLVMKKQQKYYEVSSVDSLIEDRLTRLEQTINSIYDKMNFYDQNSEHELVTIEDKVHTIDHRLESIHPENTENNFHDENRLMTARQMSVYKLKLSHIESEIQYLQQFQSASTLKSSSSFSSSSSSSGGWKWPFFVLTLLVIGFLVGMYMMYLNLAKKWKLP